MRPLEVKLLKGCGCLALLFVVATIFFPVFVTEHPPSKTTLCLSNVKQSALGLVMYANDENDRFPPRDAWMDATSPYLKTEEHWHCPSVPKRAYGYAFNGALSTAKQEKIVDLVGTPMVYDSVNPIRNASDLCASLPLPGRHGRSESDLAGRNSVAYADGHAKGVPARAVVH